MNNQTNNNLIKSKIKGLEVTCFVVTEDQLENQQRENIFGDIFLLIATLILGVAFSKAYPDIIFLLLFLGAAMLLMSIWFKYLKYDLIKKLKKSPEVKYINLEEESDIEIIKAIYGSNTMCTDKTEKIKNKLENNKLNMIASNNELGPPDPHKGKRKTLEIIYKQNEKIITKKCNEDERITLP